MDRVYTIGVLMYVLKWTSTSSPMCVGQLKICSLEKARSLENVPT